MYSGCIPFRWIPGNIPVSIPECKDSTGMGNNRNGSIGRALCQFLFLRNPAGICGALIRPHTNPHPSPTNDLLQSLKPSTLWHGKIAVFVLGKCVPLLFRPQNVKRRKHILAIRLYIQMPYFVLLDLFMFTFIQFPFPRQRSPGYGHAPSCKDCG